MKFLLIIAMLLSSLAAMANPDWSVKCYEKGRHHGYDLAYMINVNGALVLEDCRRDNLTDPQCEERGYLKKVERQDENCLVLKHHNSESMTGRDFELCMEEQETLANPRLVPVNVTDDRQESRIWCERSIRKLL